MVLNMGKYYWIHIQLKDPVPGLTTYVSFQMDHHDADTITW